MNRSSAGLMAIVLALLVPSASARQASDDSLLEARRGFQTELLEKVRDGEPLPEPPKELFSLVSYPTPVGTMNAYLSKPPKRGQKAPAIIWITGGFPPGGADPSAWEPAPLENDQSAKSYREAGLVMMYPALRGSYDNPGYQESFYGEVDDVLAALEYLSGVEGVDPSRIYLGGHSTGGTLALLVAAASDRFRGVIAFGPVEDPAGYGQGSLTYDVENEKERRLRAPIHFLGAIRTPTFVIEGTEQGNIDSVEELRASCSNDRVHFLVARGADHFNLLAPVNALIAKKIIDAGGRALELTQADIDQAIEPLRVAEREASDLEQLAGLRRRGIDIRVVQKITFYLAGTDKAALEAVAKTAKQDRFQASEPEQQEGFDGEEFLLLRLERSIKLSNLEDLLAASAKAAGYEKPETVHYLGWGVE
ncbi:MAG: alpha/beta fold hydrolase [Planctomycetota bacterium]